ncbi:hypothetical protein ABEB36_014550 [Hypothenemus hampei]|uniref:Uncharacterized protein n=1 Tax=Hypothenemus hampei TaxID=57062 RepID=A0ABD1E245_HYPHA
MALVRDKIFERAIKLEKHKCTEKKKKIMESHRRGEDIPKEFINIVEDNKFYVFSASDVDHQYLNIESYDLQDNDLSNKNSYDFENIGLKAPSTNSTSISTSIKDINHRDTWLPDKTEITIRCKRPWDAGRLITRPVNNVVQSYDPLLKLTKQTNKNAMTMHAHVDSKNPEIIRSIVQRGINNHRNIGKGESDRYLSRVK